MILKEFRELRRDRHGQRERHRRAVHRGVVHQAYENHHAAAVTTVSLK